MLEQNLTISNKLGLHARAAAKLVKIALRYRNDITITTKNKTVQAKDIMELLLLEASKGTEITLTVSGPDEKDAMDDLATLINNKFGEE